MYNVFDPAQNQKYLERLENLNADTKPQWGKMNAGQMLAHLNVAYKMTNGKLEVKYNWFTKQMLKLFVKSTVIGSKPYKKNGQTAPAFIIEGDRDFEKEKNDLIQYMKSVEKLGKDHYDGKASPAFGPMSSQEWSIMFGKHMEHHFTQFGI